MWGEQLFEWYLELAFDMSEFVVGLRGGIGTNLHLTYLATRESLSLTPTWLLGGWWNPDAQLLKQSLTSLEQRFYRKTAI